MAKGTKIRTIRVVPLDRAGLVTPEDAERMRSRVVVLDAGDEVGDHTTDKREELLMPLEGEVVLHSPDGERPLRPGMAAFIPPNTHHNVINRGKVPARYIYVLALHDEYERVKEVGAQDAKAHHEHGRSDHPHHRSH